MRAEAEKFSLSVPILLDPSQTVARELGFTRTSETLLIDTQTWQVVYRGAIDDQLSYGGERGKPLHSYLENAIEDLLADRPIRVNRSNFVGCAISYGNREQLDFYKDILPTLQNKCFSCHSQNAGIRPFFEDFNQLKGWAPMMKETILTGLMPPWGIDDQDYEKIQDYQSLTATEKRNIIDWLDSGLEGAEDFKLSRKKKNTQVEIQIDYSAEALTEAKIPADGFGHAQVVQAGGAVPRDLWIKTLIPTSSNSAIIHHQILYVTPQPLQYYLDRVGNNYEKSLLNERDFGDKRNRIITSLVEEGLQDSDFSRVQMWTVGYHRPMVFPKKYKNLALFIPKGHYLLLETHYNRTGKPETERSTVKFELYDDTKNLLKLRTHLGTFARSIFLPPGASRTRVKSLSLKIDRDIYLFRSSYHMHLRGISARVYLRAPKEEPKVLVSVPFFSYERPAAVYFSQPILVKKGSEIYAECTFDNSDSNPFNPAPDKPVLWGQRLDSGEMCVTWFWHVEAKDLNGAKLTKD